MDADLDAVELEDLRQLAKKLSGVGLRVIDGTLKAAQQKHAAQNAKATRIAQRAARRVTRGRMIAAPFAGRAVAAGDGRAQRRHRQGDRAMPPSRDIDGDTTRVRKLPVPNMHAFTQWKSTSNQRRRRMTKLPPPEQWVLSQMNEMEFAEMIEQHIDFYVEDKDGIRRSVHLPTQFVRHYLQRHDGALPTVVAIATAPLVLADGALLAPDGLDRDRGIIFIIPEELRAVIPQRKDCTKKAVKAAMDFLCDEWLVDVATDYTGKCTIIAAALTLIERSLLPDRPASSSPPGGAAAARPRRSSC